MITVIIPVYNAEATITRALDSARAADHIICVDDGSTDKSREQIKLWQHQNNKQVIYIHQDNQGAAKARNKGIISATSDYVMFLDSDDSLAEGVIEHFKQLIQKQPAHDVYVGHMQHMKSNKLIPINSHTYTSGSTTLSRSPELMQSIGPGAKLYRRDILPQFDEDITFCEEHVFNIKCLMNRVFVTDKVVYYYHISEGSITQSYDNGSDYLKDAIKARQRVFALLATSQNSQELMQYYSYRMDELIVSYLIKHVLRVDHDEKFIDDVIRYIEEMRTNTYNNQSLNQIVLFVTLYGNKAERHQLEHYIKAHHLKLKNYILHHPVKGRLFVLKTRIKDKIKQLLH